MPGPGPQRFGPYLVLGELGRGAMGAVYRALDERAGREVALKVLHANADSNSIQRLEREGVLTAALRHPGIVAIHDAGVLEGVPYLVYELVPGAKTLEEVFPAVERDERVRLVRDVARAVGHAHAAGVVHRDLKPSNVLVTPEGQVKVADFGLASHENAARLTATNTIVGTPLYMSPEQIASARELIGAPTDVWALGVLLYHALTLSYPFEGHSLAELAFQIVNEDPTPVRRHDVTITKSMERVLAGALARHLDDRFPDGSAFADALEGKAFALRRSLSGGLLALAGLALAVAIVLGIRLGSGGPQPTPTKVVLERGEAWEVALEAGRVDEVLAESAGLEAAPQRLAWAARAALARGAPDEAQRALESAALAGLGEQAQLLLGARVSLARGASPLDRVRSARLATPASLDLRTAEAELLLRAGRVPEARDVLGDPRALPALPSRWCDPPALAAALDLALSESLRQPAGLVTLQAHPELWRKGIAKWLLGEAEFLLACLRRLSDPRTRLAARYAGPDLQALAGAARWRLEAAAGIGGPPGEVASRRIGELTPAAERSRELRGKASWGQSSGWAPLSTAEACLAQGAPEEAWALLEAFGPPPEAGPYRVEDLGRRQQELWHWLRGRALAAQLAEGAPQAEAAQAALAEFVSADVLARGLHVGIGEGLSSLRARLGEPSQSWGARRKLLEGEGASAALLLLQRFRADRRESGPTADDLKQVLALDPICPPAHYYATRAALNSNWGWEELARVQEQVRWHPHVFNDFVRLVQQALHPGETQTLFLRTGLVGAMQKSLPDEFVEGRAFLAALRADLEGLSGEETLRPRLDLLDEGLAAAPGAWELRMFRAFLRVRLGSLRAARRDLDLLELTWPQLGSVAFTRSLVLAAEGADVEAVVAELERAKNQGYKLWNHSSWGLAHYPELERLADEKLLQEFLGRVQKK